MEVLIGEQRLMGLAATQHLWDSITWSIPTLDKLDAFTLAYLECAFWASTVDHPREPPGQDNSGG